MTKVSTSIIALFLFVHPLVSIYSSPQTDPTELIQKGLEKFRQTDYSGSKRIFREILVNPEYKDYHATSYFWIAKAYIALNELDDAEKNLEHYLALYKYHQYYAEAVYLKGRLLFLQKQFENSFQVFHKFIQEFEDSPYIANAHYWSAECLYQLGHLEKAHKLFFHVIKEFPQSYKVDTAEYRISLIELKYRENELLKLIQWSQEEYLKAYERFQKKEKMYEETLSNYQEKLAALSAKDYEGEITPLTEKIKVQKKTLELQEKKISQLEQDKKELQKKLTDTQEKLSFYEKNKSETQKQLENLMEQNEKRKELMSIKEQALALKNFYLEWLSEL